LTVTGVIIIRRRRQTARGGKRVRGCGGFEVLKDSNGQRKNGVEAAGGRYQIAGHSLKGGMDRRSGPWGVATVGLVTGPRLATASGGPGQLPPRSGRGDFGCGGITDRVPGGRTGTRLGPGPISGPDRTRVVDRGTRNKAWFQVGGTRGPGGRRTAGTGRRQT